MAIRFDHYGECETFVAQTDSVRENNILAMMADVEMPFGKYKGRAISDVPLAYLDRTVSVMPPTWFIRRVQEFVDAVMQHPIICGGCCPEVPEVTLTWIENEWNKIHAKTHPNR